MKHERRPYGNKVYDTLLYILGLEKTVLNHFLCFQKVPQSFQRVPSPQILKKSGRNFTVFLHSTRLLRGIQVIKYGCGRPRISHISQASRKMVSFSLLSLCSGVPLFSSIQMNSLFGEGCLILIYFHCMDKYFYHFKNLVWIKIRPMQ